MNRLNGRKVVTAQEKAERKAALGLSELHELLDCKCGMGAETWLDNSWVFTGCRSCGIAAAAYKNFKQSQDDWNKARAI